MRGRGSRAAEGASRARAQSNIVATVLLVGMVVTSGTLIVYAGSTALSQNRSERDRTNARTAMQSVGGTINEVSSGGGNRTVDLSSFEGGETTLNKSAGEIYFNVTNRNTGASSNGSVELGALTYEQDERTVAYQNGAVFEYADNGSTVVSPPPMSYRVAGGPATLTIPVVNLTGETGGDRVDVERARVADVLREEEIDLDPETDPLNTTVLRKDHTLNITINSRYYRAWGTVFEDRLNLTTRYDHTENNVTVSLAGDYEEGRTEMECVRFCDSDSGNDFGVVESALLSDAGGSISNQPTSGSYNSSTDEDPTAITLRDNGDVRINDTLAIETQPDVSGDLHVVDGIEKVSDQATVAGDAAFGEYSGTTQFDSGKLDIGGNLSLNDTVTTNGDSVEVTVGSDKDVHYAYIGGEVTKFSRTTVTGDLYVDGDFEPTTASQPILIEGDLVVDGDVTLRSGVTVEGSVYATGAVNPNGAVVLGSTSQGDDISDDFRYGSSMDDVRKEPSAPEREAANDLIQERADDFRYGNDNATFPGSGYNRYLDTDTDRNVVGSGNYSFGTLRVGDGELRLVPDDGSIDIHVETLRVNNQGTLAVEPGANRSERVNIYVEDEIQVGNQGEVITVDSADNRVYNATNVWVYVRNDGDIKMNTQAWFTGVLYGAGGPTASGASVKLSDQAQVAGTVIGSLTQMSNQVDIYYDEALDGLPASPDAGTNRDPVYRPTFDSTETDDQYNTVVYIQTSHRTVDVD